MIFVALSALLSAVIIPKVRCHRWLLSLSSHFMKNLRYKILGQKISVLSCFRRSRSGTRWFYAVDEPLMQHRCFCKTGTDYLSSKVSQYSSFRGPGSAVVIAARDATRGCPCIINCERIISSTLQDHVIIGSSIFG